MPEKLDVSQKLCVMGLLALFLLVAVGTAIDSNNLAAHGLYEGNPGFEAAIGHIFYGLNFAVMVIGLTAVGLITIGFVIALIVVTTVLSIDRVIKPINAIDGR